MLYRNARFVLPFFASVLVAGCGGGGVQTASPPIVAPAAAALTTASTDTTDARRRRQPSPTPFPSGSYWSGTVSYVNPGSITANCGQSNFSAAYGCLNIDTSNAKVTGTPRVNQYFQMWGDLSNLPSITASTINYSSTAFPVTAPTPSANGTPVPGGSTPPPPVPVATPSGKPTSAPGGGVGAFVNGQEFPTTFEPYSPTSPWNTRVSANPTIASYSDAAVNTMFQNGSSNSYFNIEEAGGYDYGHPVYFASANDPVVNLFCDQRVTGYFDCGAPDNGGVPKTIRIPAKAQAASGQDSSMTIIQPDGTEIDFFATVHDHPQGWNNGDTVRAGNISNCGSIYTGPGFEAIGPSGTAGGQCDQGGQVRANELVAGSINHAIALQLACEVGSGGNTGVYPSVPSALTQICTGGVGVPLGAHLWYDVPDSVTNANGSLQPFEKAILNAFHDYGGYFTDNGSGGAAAVGFGIEMDDINTSSYLYGTGDAWAPLASQGWTRAQGAGSGALPQALGLWRYQYNYENTWAPSGVSFSSAHWHWLAPCAAQRAC